MTIVASIFRDADRYLDRYFDQIRQLRDLIDCDLYLAEGDSTDDTWRRLLNYSMDTWPEGTCELHKIEHGGRKFTSVDHPERWNQIATVWNTLLDKIPQDGPLILVEADLIWEPQTMVTLLDGLTREGVDAIAPQSLKGDRFYDVWGYRYTDGQMFGGEVHPSDEDIYQISSAGSCIAMLEEVYRDCRFGENDGIVGFCRDMHFKGYSLWLDPSVSTEHP